jgi:hypothetical protein
MAAIGGGVRTDILPGDGFGTSLVKFALADCSRICVRLLTIQEYGGMNFVLVAGDFANNAVGWKRSVMKVGLRLLAKCGATLHLLINPDPLLGFYILKVWKPGFVLSRAMSFVSLAS